MKRKLALGLCLFFMVAGSFVACGGGSSGSSSTTSSSSASSSSFPVSLAIVSPLAGSSSSANISSLQANPKFVTAYSDATSDINDIFNGASITDCDFDASLFLTPETDAACYGPEVDFSNHPDWTAADVRYPTDDGKLPVGDLGLWSETDAVTGEACAAAELNARTDSLNDRANASLQALASMVCVVNNNSLTVPTNSALDLTSYMNSMASATGLTVVFNSASITHSNTAGNNEFTSALDFTYTTGGGVSYEMAVTLVHVPDCDGDGYQGRVSYQFNDTQTAGNCVPMGSASDAVTQAGSVLYRKYSDHAMALDVRSATFCASDADAFTDGLVDPSKKYDATTDPDGWGDDFNYFIANFDPATMGGQYSYSWQAGRNDGNTRVFNIFLEEDTNTDLLSGAAFFGYGADIVNRAGDIDGFICNWAGPNGTHTLSSLAQAQYLSQASVGGLFSSDSTRLAITYAPVNSCNYAGTGTFLYDKDNDNSLADESATTAVTNNLAALTDVAASGFLMPVAPENVSVSTCKSDRLYVGTGEYSPAEYWDSVLRFENAEDIDSDVSGLVTPDATMPVKGVTSPDGMRDANNIQLNFVHSIYVWEDYNELYLGSLFTNSTNSVAASIGRPNQDVGSIGVIANASSADGNQTLSRHLYGDSFGAAAKVFQPHGIWIDETNGYLYSANSFDSTLTVYHNARTANSVATPTLAPDRTISHGDLGAPIFVFVDETNDRLFVASVAADSTTACASGGKESAIAIYENGSTVNGSVAPDYRIIGCNTRLMDGNNQTTHNVWYNAANNMLIVGHHTNEVLFYDLADLDTTTQDNDIAPVRYLEIHEQTDDSDLNYWSTYGFFYLPEKDRLYVSAGYNDPRPTSLNGGAPDYGSPPNEIKVYDGVSLSHVYGQIPPTRVINWDSGDDLYPPQALWVTEY